MYFNKLWGVDTPIALCHYEHSNLFTFSTSFLASLIFPPRRAREEKPGLSSLAIGGRTMRDAGNEVVSFLV